MDVLLGGLPLILGRSYNFLTYKTPTCENPIFWSLFSYFSCSDAEIVEFSFIFLFRCHVEAMPLMCLVAGVIYFTMS